MQQVCNQSTLSLNKSNGKIVMEINQTFSTMVSYLLNTPGLTELKTDLKVVDFKPPIVVNIGTLKSSFVGVLPLQPGVPTFIYNVVKLVKTAISLDIQGALFIKTAEHLLNLYWQAGLKLMLPICSPGEKPINTNNSNDDQYTLVHKDNTNSNVVSNNMELKVNQGKNVTEKLDKLIVKYITGLQDVTLDENSLTFIMINRLKEKSSIYDSKFIEDVRIWYQAIASKPIESDKPFIKLLEDILIEIAEGAITWYRQIEPRL